MTPEEWEAKWNQAYSALHKVNPNVSLQKLQKATTDWMISKYGKKPPNPLPKPGVIGVIKLGLDVKRGWSMLKFTPTVIIAAVVAGTSALGAAYNLALTDGVVTSMEWVSVVWATLSAVLGTLFQSSKPSTPPPVA